MNQIKKKTKGLAVMALLLCLCVSAVAQSAMVEGRIVIGNDDSAVVTPVYPGSRLLEDELVIGEKYADEFLASGLLRVMNIQNYEADVREMMRENCSGLYKDVRFRKAYNGFEHLKGLSYELDGYLRELLKMKKVREYAVPVITRILEEFCAFYPKDFKTNVVTSLEDILTFMEAMPKHSYKLVEGENNRLDLYVDGVKNERIPGTINGFILRRILMDNVPEEEIKGYVVSMLKTLKKAKNNGNPDILCKININDEIYYYLTSTGSYFQPKKGDGKVVPCKDPCMWQELAQKVSVIKDDKETFYKIQNGIYADDRVWKSLMINSQGFGIMETLEILMDSKCEVIYEKGAVR